MKVKSTLVIVFLMVLAVSASAFLEYFTARSLDGNVKLEWKTGNETNIKEFAVERKTVQGNFLQIGSVAPKGDNSIYTFLDQNIFKTTGNVFVYRLKIIDKDNSGSYSKELAVSHNLSDIRRTWGSIKAMFR